MEDIGELDQVLSYISDAETGQELFWVYTENTQHWGKYHRKAGLLFYWFELDETRKTVVQWT